MSTFDKHDTNITGEQNQVARFILSINSGTHKKKEKTKKNVVESVLEHFLGIDIHKKN